MSLFQDKFARKQDHVANILVDKTVFVGLDRGFFSVFRNQPVGGGI